jgi:hypothetical protein
MPSTRGNESHVPPSGDNMRGEDVRQSRPDVVRKPDAIKSRAPCWRTTDSGDDARRAPKVETIRTAPQHREQVEAGAKPIITSG